MATPAPSQTLHALTVDGVEIMCSREQTDLIRSWHRRGAFLGAYIMNLKKGEKAIVKRMEKAGLCAHGTVGNNNAGWGPAKDTRVRFTDTGAALVRKITRRSSVQARASFPWSVD